MRGKHEQAFRYPHHCSPPSLRYSSRPTLRSFNALKEKHGTKFEIVYVSSDQDRGAFDHYFQQMTWYSVPFESKEFKQQLDETFGIEGIPTVVMLKRSKTLGGKFVLMPGGREVSWAGSGMLCVLAAITAYPSAAALAT